MKETWKIIPFVLACLAAFVLYCTNPDEGSHVEQIKAQHTQANPGTGWLTWIFQKLSLDFNDYLFLSVVKDKNDVASVGVLGKVYVVKK